MANVARDVIIPKQTGILRVVFLYVGQGDSTLLVVPSTSSYKYVLVDSHLDKELGGIDLVAMLTDLLDQKLDVFVNTHPHLDHLKGVKEIFGEVGTKEVWHSNHIPGGDHKDSYNDLKEVIDKIGEENVYHLKGSRELNKLDDEYYGLGDIDFNILSPAEYVTDEIADEKPEERYRRIHEQCGVIKFIYGTEPKEVLITGDSNSVAWKEHITEYHKERLPSFLMTASHHGSNSFFKQNEEDEEYTDHLAAINPTHLVVSAPKQSESKHGHPADEAMKIYRRFVAHDNIYHLGKNRECVILDIYSNGETELLVDKDLVAQYGFKEDDGGKGGKKGAVTSFGIVGTKIDNKPMGSIDVV
jgi:competence protein ComEC